MAKLIELLNEYEPYIQSDGTHTDNFWWYVSQGHSAVFPKEIGIDRIISKQYGFVKWLVENDKIDMEKVTDRMENRMDTDNSCDVANVLMNLAISDTPIEDLISYLK